MANIITTTQLLLALLLITILPLAATTTSTILVRQHVKGKRLNGKSTFSRSPVDLQSAGRSKQQVITENINIDQSSTAAIGTTQISRFAKRAMQAERKRSDLRELIPAIIRELENKLFAELASPLQLIRLQYTNHIISFKPFVVDERPTVSSASVPSSKILPRRSVTSSSSLVQTSKAHAKSDQNNKGLAGGRRHIAHQYRNYNRRALTVMKLSKAGQDTQASPTTAAHPDQTASVSKSTNRSQAGSVAVEDHAPSTVDEAAAFHVDYNGPNTHPPTNN